MTAETGNDNDNGNSRCGDPSLRSRMTAGTGNRNGKSNDNGKSNGKSNRNRNSNYRGPSLRSG